MSEDKLPKGTSGDPGGDPGGTDDDLLRRAAREIRASPSLQALVPLSSSERERLADAAIERVLGEAKAPAASSEPAASSAPVLSSEPAASSAPVLSSEPAASSAPVLSSEPASPSAPAPGRPVTVAPWNRSRFGARSVGAGLVAGLALAAAVALVVHGGRRSVEPLAAYSMVIEGEQRTRGATQPSGPPGEPVKLHSGTRLVVRLATAKPERDALLRLVLVRNGRATLLDPPVTRGKAGTLEIAGPAAELLGAQSDGAAELVVVLGRELPGDDEIRALALAGSGEPPAHLQVMRRAILLEGFSHAAIDVLLGGCSAVLGPGARGGGLPRCEIAAGARLQLWVGVPATAAVAIDIDGRALEPKAEARGGGAAFDIEVPARTGRLSVRMEEQAIGAWEIAPAASFVQVRAADDARKAGRFEEADAYLDAMSGQAPAEERLEAVRVRAKIALRRGEVGKARSLRTQAVALARSLGRVSVESDETLAIIHGLISEHELAPAVQRLHALDAYGMIYAEGAMDRDFIHGFLASELGDLGAALGSLQRSLTIAERIGNEAGRATPLGLLGDVLQSLGRDGEARGFIDAEIQRAEQDDDVCARVDALTNAGWLLRDRDPSSAQRRVDQAAALAGERCEGRLPIALVNQGWLLAAAGRFGEARAVLDRLARGPHAPDARIKTWALRLEAETILGEDPARAEQHARELAARAAELCSTELLYEAQLLRARALVALDRPAQAAAAFTDAEHALTLWSRLVPLGEGRATFFQRHDQLAFTAIPFFLAQRKRGEPGAGLALAATMRHSIARFVTSLASGGRVRARAERGDATADHTRQFEQTLERWPVGPGTKEHQDGAVAGVCETRDAEARVQEELAIAEPPSHAALFVHPAPQGWLALAWRGSSIDVREIPRAGAGERPDELSARIAKVVAPMLVGAPRVHLHVHRSLAALPLDRSLAAVLAVPIAFAMDARPRSSGASCPGARRALLVTNPRQDLWAASESAPRLAGELARMGFVVDTLEGAAATRAAIEGRLADPCTALFHYDGHGSFAVPPTPGGVAGGGLRDRTDDALLLAGGDTLTAADVLDLARVPAAVVLDGCTTAAPEGLGLAQAFLLAGAAQVVASIDELPAADAARFTNKLYEAAPPSVARVDLVSLFAQAMSAMDIPALRVFER